jgi:hypothetical protein
LRSLFVLMTLFACWLGYQINWIRERRAIVNDLERWDVVEEGFDAPPAAPGLLWLLGEPGYETLFRVVLLPDGDEVPESTAGEITRAKAVFPESNIELSIFHVRRESSTPSPGAAGTPN